MDHKQFVIDTVDIILADGKPRTLRYTNASIKRLLKHFNLHDATELGNITVTDCLAPFLLEGFLDKGENLTEEQVDELIPAQSLLEVFEIIKQAFNGALPEPTKNAQGVTPAAQPATPASPAPKNSVQ